MAIARRCYGSRNAASAALTCRMALDPRTPVIVGVGQYVHRAATVDDGVEPVALMVERGGRRRRRRRARRAAPARSTRSGWSTCCRGATATRRGCWPSVSASTPSSSPTPPPGATPHRPSSTARPSTSPPAGPTSSCSPAARRGGPGCGSSRAGTIVDWAKAPETATPTDDRRRARHDASGRGGPGHLPPRAGVPVVRIGDQGGGRERRRTSTSPRSPGCGRASAPWQPPTRTPGRPKR